MKARGTSGRGERNIKKRQTFESIPDFPFTTPTGACYDFFLSLDYSKKPQGRNLKCQIFIQQFFKIVLYWCLDLIRHNISTHLKHNKYIFDISIPFCHPSCLHVSTRPNCYVRFDWSVIFRVLIANQHSLQS